MGASSYDKATVDTWLNNGGAEIVLDVLLRSGWKIEVLTGDDWPYLPGIVVAGDRERQTMAICGDKSPWVQAFFAVLVADRDRPVRDRTLGYRERDRAFWLPLLQEDDKFETSSIDLCYKFIEYIRICSEAAIAHMNAVSAAGRR